ncbi:MAG: NUDIX domain-containing protein [Anaerolineales bacterium]|nr:NUDIX domain-containing protein [Anaerolineales bacterium]
MPRLGVGLAIMRYGKILLTKRQDFPIWCLPGGEVEDNESIVEAALREAKEETGLNVELIRFVGLYSRPNWWDGGSHEIIFSARVVGGELVTSSDETTDAKFYNPSELPEDLVWWHHQRILDALGPGKTVVRTQFVEVPYGSSREEMYRLRDQGEIPIEEFLKRLCGRAKPDLERLEIAT